MCVYMFIYTCMYIYVYVCVYIYIYTHISCVCRGKQKRELWKSGSKCGWISPSSTCAPANYTTASKAVILSCRSLSLYVFFFFYFCFSLSVSVSVALSVSLSGSLSVSLSVCLSLSRCVCLSLSLSFSIHFAHSLRWSLPPPLSSSLSRQLHARIKGEVGGWGRVPFSRIYWALRPVVNGI